MSFTCISCHVAFKEAAIQREHYKTDWHRYNLKRKVADLPPVTAEIFQDRVLEQRAQAAKQEALQTFSTYCQCCRKKFSSQKSFENHLQSKKHQDNVLLKPEKESKPKGIPIIGSDDEMEEVSSEEWEDEEVPIAPSDCFFCNHKSENIEDNYRHMSKEHSFFIPDLDYVTDLEGLLTYLGERIGQGHICLWCGHLGRQFPSTESVKKHMIDKGHCKMYHEGEVLLEYADFYDYSTSYPDEGDAEAEIEENILNDSGFELVLPSGATIGHRSLYRYYRQRLNPVPQPKPTRTAIHCGSHLKAIGWNASSSREVVERKVKDIKFMRVVVSKYNMKLGVDANKLQKHFRRQVDF